MNLYNTIYKKDIENYMNLTTKSKNNHQFAKEYMPGGETRTICFHKPYPLTIKKAQGAYLYDLDHNRYIDFLNNYTAMVHGHAHEAIIEKVQTTLSYGTAYAASIPEQAEFAELLCERIPSVEKIRFCNSGTEATMFAIRAARTFTGKTGIIKMDGSYHGTHDLAIWEPNKSTTVFPQNISQDIYVAPFNDSKSIEKILSNNPDEIAAIIVEPVMGVAGVLPPKEGFLNQLRKLANKYQALLIFDEVQTLRLHTGGAQEKFDVIPDLTTMGKIIGGGFPVGAFGGKKEIMNIFDPYNDDFLSHGGTFNGNRVTMSAGIAAMQLLDEKKIKKINKMSANLKGKIIKVAKQLKIPVSLTQTGSMLNVHFTESEPENYVSTLNSNRKLMEIMHLKLLNHGIFIAPRGLMNLSTVMTEEDIQKTADAFSEVLQEMKILFNH